MVELIVRYLNENARGPEKEGIKQAHPGEWTDLYVAQEVTLKAGESTLIPLGVNIKVPDGYESLLAPRSGAFRTYGLLQTNSIGVIDQLYCGNNDEWKLPVYATKDTTVPAGARICQFRILPCQPEIHITEVTSMPYDNRGGFGSTGG